MVRKYSVSINHYREKTITVFPHIVSTETILFLNLEIQRSQYIRPMVTVHKGAETIQERKLFKGRNCKRKYGNFLSKQIVLETKNFVKL